MQVSLGASFPTVSRKWGLQLRSSGWPRLCLHITAARSIKPLPSITVRVRQYFARLRVRAVAIEYPRPKRLTASNVRRAQIGVRMLSGVAQEYVPISISKSNRKYRFRSMTDCMAAPLRQVLDIPTNCGYSRSPGVVQ